MKVISLLNEKGGVGKSTTSLALIDGLAKRGYKVVAIDNDPQGNLTSVLLPNDAKPTCPTFRLYEGKVGKPQNVKENVWLCSVNRNLKATQFKLGAESVFAECIKTMELSGMVDYVIIDNSPAITTLTQAAIRASTDLIVVTTAERWAVEGMAEINKTVNKLKAEKLSKAEFLGILVNMFTKTRGQRRIYNELRKKYPTYLYETLLYKRVAHADAVTNKKSIYGFVGADKAEQECTCFVNETLRRLGDA